MIITYSNYNDNDTNNDDANNDNDNDNNEHSISNTNNNNDTNNNITYNIHHTTYTYGKFSEFQICFCGLDPGNLKFETVRTHKQHMFF